MELLQIKTTKKWFRLWRPLFFSDFFGWIFNAISAVWFFFPEIRSLRGRIVARTAVFRDPGLLVCSSTEIFHWNTQIPQCQRKTISAIYCSGAYGIWWKSEKSLQHGFLYGCYPLAMINIASEHGHSAIEIVSISTFPWTLVIFQFADM